jgi:hypothetical protein
MWIDHYAFALRTPPLTARQPTFEARIHGDMPE